MAISLRKILVGVELDHGGTKLSGGSRRALEQSCQLAGRVGAKLHLVHSTYGGEHLDITPDTHLWTTREGISKRGKEAIEKATEAMCSSGVDAQVELSELRPWRAITEAAIKQSADIVVVGKRDQNDFDFDDRKLGAVAVRLLRRCPCTVWTVSQDADTKIDKILAATDLSKSVGSKVLKHAAALAEVYGAELHVVHACGSGWSDVLLDEGGREYKLEAATAKAKSAIEKALADYPGTPQLHVVTTKPIRAIVNATLEIAPDLLVMGTVSRSAIGRTLVGSTAERIFGLVDRPLLTVKPDDFRPPGRGPRSSRLGNSERGWRP